MNEQTKTTTEVCAEKVIFRTAFEEGQLVICIWTNTTSPRVGVWKETAKGRVPVVIFLDELLDYVMEALRTKGLKLDLPS
jgi:hypothetical protein